MAMSRSVLLFSTILAFTAICWATPLENQINPPDNEGDYSMMLSRGLQEIKPLDLGPIVLRSVDLFEEKTSVRAGCSSAGVQTLKACIEQCTSSCGSQCCLNYDMETKELTPATSKCAPAGSSTSGGGGASSGGGGTSSGGGGASSGGGSSQSPTGASGPSGTPAAQPKQKENSSPNPLNCFAASALVELESGIPKRMDELAVGDRVKVGNNLYSDVFMFTHKIPAVRNNFVVIRTVSGEAITLTPGHFIYLNNALVDSATAKVGDTIFLGSGAVSVVSSVSQTVEAGLYNPQTVHGDIVVNGIIASTYTTALPPGTAHALLLPLRALYSAFSLQVNCFDNGAVGTLVGNILADS
jgi:Hint module